MTNFTARPELSGTFGAVASTHWIASAVGMRILERGGNAFDAAAAAGFVLQVVEPHLNGPGGDAPILVSRHDDVAPTVICGQGFSPAAATPAAFAKMGLDLIPPTGLLAACVPGAFGAWLVMLRDYGTFSLRDILEPAIHYARSGHPILASAVATISSVADLFSTEWPTSARIFLPHGSPPVPGTLFRNTELADFYERLLRHAESSSSGRQTEIDAALAYWYEGEVAETIDRFCRETEAMDSSGERHSGLLSGDDFNGWRPPVEAPLSIDDGDYEIFKCGAWSQGPSLLQAIRILQGFRIEDHAPDSASYVHLVTETIKLVMADRDAWYGDTDDVPVSTLLSPTYAAKRRALIGTDASLSLRPGAIDGRQGVLPRLASRRGDTMKAIGGGEPTMARDIVSPDGKPLALQQGDTCHIDVVDRWGNMVSATPSGGWLQSSPSIPGLGFALGTRMQMFWLEQGLPNSLAPRKRPRTTLSPSLAFKHGRPYLAFGTPGGDQQDQWSLLLWMLHTRHEMPLQKAIETPAFHTDHMVASFWPRRSKLGSITLESRFPQNTVEALRKRGHDVTVGGAWSEGRLSACSLDRVNGQEMMRAGANPRGMQGYAIVR